MKVYAGCDPRLPLADLPGFARRVERLGFDGLHVAETIHDSLMAAALAVTATDRLVVRTAVTLAFTRSPTQVAYSAWDLAVLSGGRFELGLGTQVRAHIEGRFAMPWGDPAGRLSDYLGALGALFESFGSGVPPEHHGQYYDVDRLPPYFNPGPDPQTAAPAVWVGGVGPAMCQVAGAAARGLLTHPTNSDPRYLDAVVRPQLAAGATTVGRDPAAVGLVVGGPVATGGDRVALERAREHQRRTLAYLYSTPAYRATLALYGWEGLGERLHERVRAQRLDELADLVDDDVLDALVPSATYSELPGVLAARYGRQIDGILLAVPEDPVDDAAFSDVVGAVRSY